MGPDAARAGSGRVGGVVGADEREILLRRLDRYLDAEGRPVVEAAVNADRAAVALDDAVADREAEAGALPDRLGRKKRVEDFAEVLGGDAAPRVGDGDDHRLALEACRDAHFPALADRLGGVG